MANRRRGPRSRVAATIPAATILAAVLMTILIGGYGPSWPSISASASVANLDASRAAAGVRAARPCGVYRHHPKTYRHVVWVVMENRSFDQIIGSSAAPYINNLAHKCGLATRFYAEAHPSLPNYIAMTSGSTHGITDDAPPASHRLGSRSLFGQMKKNWRSLEQSMPSRCDLVSSGKYAVKHNPAAYYTRIRSRCRRRDVRLSNPPDISARFTFVTPNLCNDMHSCSTSVGDTWLSNWLPKVLKTRQYRSGSTAIFLTWDEGSGSQPIATLVISPYTPAGTTSARRLNHYSMLRTTEAMLGRKRFLGRAATARGMRGAFHL